MLFINNKVFIRHDKFNEHTMSLTHTNNALTFIITLSFALLGVSFALGANPNTLTATFSFYELDTLLSVETLGLLTGTAMIALALATLAAHLKLLKPMPVAVLALIVCIVPLLTLLASNRWMAQLGGFQLLAVGKALLNTLLLFLCIYFCFIKISSPTNNMFF